MAQVPLEASPTSWLRLLDFICPAPGVPPATSQQHHPEPSFLRTSAFLKYFHDFPSERSSFLSQDLEEKLEKLGCGEGPALLRAVTWESGVVDHKVGGGWLPRRAMGGDCHPTKAASGPPVSRRRVAGPSLPSRGATMGTPTSGATHAWNVNIWSYWLWATGLWR